jgi:hypothetical protein
MGVGVCLRKREGRGSKRQREIVWVRAYKRERYCKRKSEIEWMCEKVRKGERERVRKGERERECVWERERECVCVRKTEREREREREKERKREREREWERERERERRWIKWSKWKSVPPSENILPTETDFIFEFLFNFYFVILFNETARF